MADHLDMDGLIEYLKSIISKRFSSKIAQIYYGDIGVYLPSSFGSSRKEQKAIIVLSPSYNRLMDNERNAASEYRLLGVDIIGLVNITPFFRVDPPEAFGEKMLVTLITEIATFLTQEENINLQDHVHFTTVRDIDWSWFPKGDQAIRGVAISYEARVRIPRTN